MKIQTRATNVLEKTSHYLKVGVLKQKPAWFDAVGAHPPAVDLTKKTKPSGFADPAQSLGSSKTRSLAEDRRAKHDELYQTRKLAFLEDEIRDVFYHQHPWEFSRPKTLVETTGDNQRGCDWLRMLQPTRALDGELVVQRTVYLLNQGALTVAEAYDAARFEFYRLRMAEEMNSEVLREELQLYGAVYPILNTQWGLHEEQAYIDLWAQVASDKTKVMNANKSQETEKVDTADETPAWQLGEMEKPE